MILSDIKKYLQTCKRATLSDLAIHFDSDPEAMRGMLAQWIAKGKVAKIVPSTDCQEGCAACGCKKAMEIYVWRA